MSWLGPEALEEAEKALPQLLRDGTEHWGSLVSATPDHPKIERLYRPFGDCDLFLIRITDSAPDFMFFSEPENGASVGRVIEGCIDIAISDPRHTGDTFDHLLACSVSTGNWYACRSDNRSSWRPQSPVSLHLVLCRNPVTLDPNPAPPETVLEILARFRSHYMDEATRDAARRRVFGY